MDEPPFALSMRLALPASIIAKGGSFSTVSTLRLYSSTSLACGFSYENKKDSHQKLSFLWCSKAIQIRTISL